VLATQREAVARRHERAVSRVGSSRACPFDLHALLPVPAAVLRLGPDDPRSDAWLWQHWGTTQALRHVTADAIQARDTHPAHDAPAPGAMDIKFWALDWSLGGRCPPLSGAGRPCASTCVRPTSWRDGRRRRRAPPPNSAPVPAIDGFEGPLNWLLEMVRTRRIELGRLSIAALIDGFAIALDAALAQSAMPPGRTVPLGRWGDWLVMTATLALLRSQLLLPADAPGARDAQTEAEALRQRLLHRAQTAAADWLAQRPQLGQEVFGRGMPGREPISIPTKGGTKRCSIERRLRCRHEMASPSPPASAAHSRPGPRVCAG
jgi:hypothetical protein